MALLCSNCGAQLSDNEDACADCGHLSPSAAAVFTNTLGAQQPTKTCPYCAETILAAAIKCKHCGERLDAPVKTPPAEQEVEHKFVGVAPPPAPAREGAAPSRPTGAAPSRPPGPPRDAAEVAEFQRQLRELAETDDEPSPNSRGPLRRLLPHVVLVVACALAGVIVYNAYDAAVVGPADAEYRRIHNEYGDIGINEIVRRRRAGGDAGLNSIDRRADAASSYRREKERERDTLGFVVPAALFVLGELVLWRRRKKQSAA